MAIGHNERVAWGFTIVGTDQADLYVEETNPADGSNNWVVDGTRSASGKPLLASDPHRAIDWLSTFPQVVLLAIGLAGVAVTLRRRR